jgi:hypothetical protein
MSASVFASCERHIPYETRELAQQFIKARWAMGRKKAEGLKVFKCPSGKHYHVGRDRRFRRR